MPCVKKNIIWLASYPKSGNTWFRIFLQNLFSDSEEPKNINHLQFAPIASSRLIFDKYLGVNSSDLTNDEIENLRPEVYRMISAQNESFVFLKTHDAWILNNNGNPLFPEEITRGVIYFIRNPLDIAVSFAFHDNNNFEKTISKMNDLRFGFCLNNSKLRNQIPQHLLSWSKHVISWVHRSNLPVYVMRYENMIEEPEETFSKALEFLNIEYTESKLSLALQNSSFEKLSKQEKEYGFIEKKICTKKFFRSGTRNNWRIHLKNSHIKQIIKFNRNIMKEFGYLT